MNYHRHVSLTRSAERYNCWIPEAFAKLGRVLRIKMSGAWSEGWMVAAVYTRLPSEYVHEHSRNYLSQREASDA